MRWRRPAIAGAAIRHSCARPAIDGARKPATISPEDAPTCWMQVSSKRSTLGRAWRRTSAVLRAVVTIPTACTRPRVPRSGPEPGRASIRPAWMGRARRRREPRRTRTVPEAQRERPVSPTLVGTSGCACTLKTAPTRDHKPEAACDSVVAAAPATASHTSTHETVIATRAVSFVGAHPARRQARQESSCAMRERAVDS